MNHHELRRLLGAYLESDAGRQLMLDLAESNRYLRLAISDGENGKSVVLALTGDGFKRSQWTDDLRMAITSGDYGKLPTDLTLEDAVRDIAAYGSHCCVRSFMYWLEKVDIELSGVPIPNVTIGLRNGPPVSGNAIVIRGC